MITARHTERMRGLVEQHLSGTCAIYQKAAGQSATGSPTSGTPTIRASGVPCRLAVSRASNTPFERFLTVEQRGIWLYFLLTLKHDQEIEATDTVVISGKTYEVVTPDPELTSEVRKRVMIRRLASA